MAAILSRPQCVKKWLCYSGHRVALVVHRAQKSVPDSAGEWPTFLPPPLESCSGTANVDGPNSNDKVKTVVRPSLYTHGKSYIVNATSLYQDSPLLLIIVKTKQMFSGHFRWYAERYSTPFYMATNVVIIQRHTILEYSFQIRLTVIYHKLLSRPFALLTAELVERLLYEQIVRWGVREMFII